MSSLKEFVSVFFVCWMLNCTRFQDCNIKHSGSSSVVGMPDCYSTQVLCVLCASCPILCWMNKRQA